MKTSFNKSPLVVYDEGWDAAAAGKLRSSNPYPIGSKLASKWLEGYNNCQKDINNDPDGDSYK